MSGQVLEQYPVDPNRLQAVIDVVEQLATKAQKNGLGRIEIRRAGHRGEVPLIDLSTPTPAIGDYELVAKISHMKGGRTFVTPISGVRLDFDRVRRDHATPRCDHCGLARSRRATFLIRSSVRGDAQVGSSCLKEYVGQSDPRKALVQAELFAQAREVVQAAAPIERVGDRPGNLPSIDDYLANVAAVIRSEGTFVRKKDVGEDETSTADLAIENFRQLEGRGGDPIDVTAKDRSVASDFKKFFLDWASREDGLTGFDLRLQHCLEKDVAWPDVQGIVATVFPRVTALRKKPRRGRWLGEIKEKITTTVDLRKVGNPRETKYGPQYPHFFLTPEGDWVTWWATNIQLEEGNRYEIALEISKLEEHKGHKVTVLTGCRTSQLI